MGGERISRNVFEAVAFFFFSFFFFLDVFAFIPISIPREFVVWINNYLKISLSPL